MLSKNEFAALKAQGFSHIPLVKKMLMDTQTPVAVLANIQQINPSAYLFESVVGGERLARYSIIGIGDDVVFDYKNGIFGHSQCGKRNECKTGDPFSKINAFMRQFSIPKQDCFDALPPFSGGLVGYFGYDVVRTIEPLGQSDAPNPLGLPDLWLMLSTKVVVFDNLENTLSIIVYADCSKDNAYDEAKNTLEYICQITQQPPNLSCTPTKKPQFTSHTGVQKFCQDVQKIKDYILAGDVMQVVLAQRMSADYDGDALSLYRALRYLNPSPYLFSVHGCFKGQEFDIIGASPEILSRMQDGKVTVRPLAGTRVRGKTEQEDSALEAELLADKKEIAEHLMLIDLGRNDVAKVSQIGSVRVTDKMFIERYSHVMHIASNVEGRVLPSKNALDVFSATFPAGTLTGAPKLRAMQIIDELEPMRRTVFGGAVGYIGFSGNMDTAIAIRTAVLTKGQVHVQAGAGVVADSDANSEWQETQNKARAIIKAVELAADGLVLDN